VDNQPDPSDHIKDALAAMQAAMTTFEELYKDITPEQRDRMAPVIQKIVTDAIAQSLPRPPSSAAETKERQRKAEENRKRNEEIKQKFLAGGDDQVPLSPDGPSAPIPQDPRPVEGSPDE